MQYALLAAGKEVSIMLYDECWFELLGIKVCLLQAVGVIRYSIIHSLDSFAHSFHTLVSR